MKGCYFCVHKSVLRPFLKLINSYKKDVEELGAEITPDSLSIHHSLIVFIGLSFPLRHIAVFAVVGYSILSSTAFW